MSTTKKIKANNKQQTAALVLSPPQWALWLVWVVYSGVVLYVTAHHEPWRDEAQSWLIARDNSLLGLFRYLPNEGHPPLWYLILMPFAKLGLPYSTANLLHNFIVIAFAWLLLFRLRLNFVLSVALLFSYYFIYEYAVIARNYSFVALLLAFAGMLYEKRFEKPLLFALVVFLLFQTNVLAFCTGVGLGAIFFLDMIEEKRWQAKNFAALGIMAAGGLAMIALLLSAGMESSYSKATENVMKTLNETFGNAIMFNSANGIFGMMAYALIAASFFRKPKALLFLLIATAGFLYLALFQFQGTLRHHGFLLMFLLGGFIIAKATKPLKQFEQFEKIELGGVLLFTILMGLQGLKALPVLSDEIDLNFSDSRKAGEFIMSNGLDKFTIVGHRSYAASAVAPYLPKDKKIWYADQQRFGTFIYLDTVFFNNYMKYNGDYAPYIVQEKFERQDSIILLMNTPIQYPDFQKMWLPVFQSNSEPIKRDEAFIIYKRVAP